MSDSKTQAASVSYWQGPGHAPNYSRAVESALADVRAAERALQEVLQSEYPTGADVTVIHHRGQYHGVVVGHDYSGARVAVKNNRTKKVTKWWAANVQLAAKLEA